jgi:hypothetical protein
MKIDLIIPLAPGAKIESLDEIKKQSINLIKIEGVNPSKNRNEGIKKAKSELIAFTNAHSIISDDWSREVISFFKKNKNVDIVGGPQLTPEKDSFFSKASGVALQSIFGSSTSSNRYKRTRLKEASEADVTSANLICKKRVFKKVEFDESIYPGEDPNFIRDAKAKKFKVFYSPDIIVYNSRRSNIKSFIKQIFLYGKFRAIDLTIFQNIKNPSFLIPSIFLIYLMIVPTLLALSIYFIVPLALYISMNISFSIFESLRSKLKYIVLLPLLFVTIHISYGAGFIYGKISKI